MSVQGLSGRLRRLEASACQPPAGRCGACRLPHSVPVRLAEAFQQCVGWKSGVPPALCMCDCCDKGRWYARVSHGLPLEDPPSTVGMLRR